MPSSRMSLALLAATTAIANAQDVPSLISLLLGGTAVSPSKGADVTAFSQCTDLASLVVSDAGLNVLVPTFSNTDVEAVAWGVCTLGGCTGVGLSRMDKCCSVATSDYNGWASQFLGGVTSFSSYPTAANDCFSKLAGAAQAQPSPASASATGAASSTAGPSTTTPAASTEQVAADTSSSPAPTSAPSGTSDTGAPASTQTSASKNFGGHVDNNVLAGSALALLVGLVGIAL